jgi:hypothetical protein
MKHIQTKYSPKMAASLVSTHLFLKFKINYKLMIRDLSSQVLCFNIDKMNKLKFTADCDTLPDVGRHYVCTEDKSRSQ